MARRAMLALSDWGVCFALQMVLCAIQSTSLEACGQAARWLAFLFSDVLRIRRQTVEANLKIAFPEMGPAERQRLRRRMWEHLVLMVCEIAHAPRKLHETNWRKHIAIEGRREIVTYLLDRRPTVIVSGHFGNFEVGGYLIGLLGFPTYSIARTLDNRQLEQMIKDFRERKGQFIVPKDGSGTLVAQILERGDKVALLADHHAGPKGCWVDFLGQPTSCHKAVALFTLSSGAPMLSISNARGDRPMSFRVRLEGLADPVDLANELASVPSLTRWYNQALENAIRRSPDQYWWLHRRWRGEPPRRRSAENRSSATPPATPPAPVATERPGI